MHFFADVYISAIFTSYTNMKHSSNEKFTMWKTIKEYMNMIAAAVVVTSSLGEHTSGDMEDKLLTKNAIVRVYIATVTDLSRKNKFGRRRAVHVLIVLTTHVTG